MQFVSHPYAFRRRVSLALCMIGAFPACMLLAPLEDVAAGRDGDRGTTVEPGGVQTDGPPASGGSGGVQTSAPPVSGGSEAPQGSGGAQGCTPHCDGDSCVGDDGCGGTCRCAPGTACDPVTLLCDPSTCGEGIWWACDEVLDAQDAEAFARQDVPYCYEPVVTDDEVCPGGYAVHLHCNLCSGVPADGFPPLCWARCACAEEVPRLLEINELRRHCTDEYEY